MKTLQSPPDPSRDSEEGARSTRALRSTAHQAVALVGGGVALVYTKEAGHPTSARLRAAAGFPSPDEARQASSELFSLVRAVLDEGLVRSAEPLALASSRATGGVLALPMSARDEVLGVLVVAAPTPVTLEKRDGLEILAWTTALQVDHPRLTRQYETLREDSEKHLEVATAKNDELLELSETLFAQDIELLQNNEKLGKIEKLKNDFIEKMSRELRTPLNNIIEATISVLAGEHEKLSATSRQMLRNALDEGTAFQRTLQNILDLWRIKQGELPIEIQELSFAEVIDETIFSVQDTLGEKPVEISKTIPEPLPRIRGDLTKINQILFLLLDNAAKFTEQGSITIGARFADDRLVCWVEDTGIGILPDDQKHIWEDFYQVDDRASMRYRGAGLGLTLAHDLLMLLGGESSLRSEPGIGTRVEFSVPVTLA